MKEWEAAYLAGVIDGEGSIMLTRMHKKEFRRPCISIASTDLELLQYVQSLTGGIVIGKKNYQPNIHKKSFTLTIKKKNTIFSILNQIVPFLRIDKKRNRALFILGEYNRVTSRNGKYTTDQLNQKLLFEKNFFELK
ncbi:LAGLIDADG family homing endonuclease [Fictibacillus sp. 7GRE50]|uniref:LAGLIDADG family homing endonuclease n=1 Tax=unclassified Fictibacillus TaxID=2644029 RepID=UPI0018CD6FF5|nr:MULTISPECIES: LAGLIDADG family homing endonuclease [unclassified Fictibacillus]MBH0163842.1 LAGLIDADG family homing endonuclease [Fictibacillus sp. 7GRE50]MBH0174031.1 LAGLIDADG family homing endonuclease [Fictibacillus sp. 23RED33]